MCASRLSAAANETSPSGAAAGLKGSEKLTSKAPSVISQNPKDSGRNGPATASGALPAPPAPVPVPVSTTPEPVPTAAPKESSAVPASSLTTPANAACAGANVPTLSPAAASPDLWALGFTTQTESQAFGVTASNSDVSLSSDGTGTDLATGQQTLPPPSQQESSPQPGESAEALQNQIATSVLSAVQTAQSADAAFKNDQQPAGSVPSPGTAGSPDGAASSLQLPPTGTEAASMVSTVADPVFMGSQVLTTTAFDNLPVQSNSANSGQASPIKGDLKPSSLTPGENIQQGNVPPPVFLSPVIQQTDPKQPAVPQPSPATSSNAVKQSLPNAQNLRAALHTLGTDALASSSELRQSLPLSDATLHAPQPATPSTTSSVVPPINPVAGGNPFVGTSTTAANNSPKAVVADNSVSTVGAQGVAANMGSQSNTSGGDSSDPSLHKNSATFAATLAAPSAGLPVGSPQAGSPQSATAVLVDPAVQVTSGQPATPSSANKSDSSSPAGSPDSPSNLPAAKESPLTPSAGPVQVAQIVNRVAQSEMRIGLNTSAFGNVEVRTVVHANDVGVLIGSEKGDLRSLLANELPSIASTLQQHDLRLNQVHFHQGFAFSNNMTSGGDSQPRSFTPRSTVSALPVEAQGGESGEPAELPGARSRSGGLSILA